MIEPYQLAGVALAIVGAAWAVAQAYFRKQEKWKDDMDTRLREIENLRSLFEAHDREDLRRFSEIALTSTATQTKMDEANRHLTDLQVGMGRIEERLEIRNEIRGLVGKRKSDEGA